MDKSYVEFLKGLYVNILRDVDVAYPKLRHEWTRDSSRLLSCIDRHGIEFVTLLLPDCGKHFDRCLSQSTFVPSRLAHQRPYGPGTVIPRLFRGLLLMVFDDNGMLREDVDTQAVSFLRQLYYAAKKVELACEPATTYKAVSEFFDVEASLRHPTLEWNGDSLDLTLCSELQLGDFVAVERDGTPDLFGFLPTDRARGSDAALLRTIQQVADRIAAGLGELDYPALRPKHGPGAVSDLRGGTSKYSFPSWPLKLDRLFPAEEFAFANLNQWEDTFESRRKRGEFSHHEPPARLIAVPKTLKGPRLIAAEPTAHQWCQQALWRELERKVAKSPLRNCLDFRDQRISGEMALRASLDQTFCTIDLKSASDRLSCFLVERIFRKNFSLLEAFHSVRTRWLVNGIDKKSPKYVVLRKFTTQGSALTFPVQSIVFAIITIGCLLHARGRRVDRVAIDSAARQVRIFGDDIIAPNDVYGVLSSTLEVLGLKVNPQKSFAEGNFRESCGVDAYAGVDVTPAYVLKAYKQSRPESVVSLVECSNNFYKKGLWHAAEYLQKTVPEKIRKLIPTVTADSGAFGWLSFCGSDTSSLRKRWSPSLHREEMRTFVVSSTSKRNPIEGTLALLQYFTESPAPDPVPAWGTEKWMSGVGTRPKVSLSLRWVPVPA